MLYKSTDLKQLAITSGVSAVFVLILVASNDLGGALLYFFTYLVMIYVATKSFIFLPEDSRLWGLECTQAIICFTCEEQNCCMA